jgi:hypothetical protein
MMAFGARCWHAFTAGDPIELWKLSQAPSPLPLMQQAILRMLKELPWTTNGLSLTEQLALEIINRDGPLDAAKVFHFLNTESEPMPFLGDIMFLAILEQLRQNEPAAIKVISTDTNKPALQKHTLQITNTGQALLANQCNWLNICSREYQRWVGNTHIAPGRKNWYWRPEKNMPELCPRPNSTRSITNRQTQKQQNNRNQQ